MLRFTAVGADWVLWLLLGLSLINIAIIVDRTLFFRSRRINVDGLAESLAVALSGKDIRRGQGVGLRLALDRMPRGAGRLAGLSPRTARHHGGDAQRQVRERLNYEALTPVLGTLGNNSPFIGLLGTVIGIIRASADLQAAQAAKTAAASAVMGGVFEALVATAVGLLVALPAVVAFNIFQRKSVNAMLRTDMLAHLLISYVKPSTSASSHDGRVADVTPPPVIAKGV
ncbi:MAG: MotA/TolQ/ExbB proton channel family protein [Pirellulales bacterium]